jgi:TM2 domain-containing membrane protein YozV
MATPATRSVHPPKNPGVAAVLSFLIPGIGQFYNGDFLRGLFWLIITPGFWIFTAGLFGWPFHIISSITAYHRAVKKNTRGWV